MLRSAPFLWRTSVVALIGLHVRLYVLGWNQTYLVSLLLQRTAQEMGASAGFHAHGYNPNLCGFDVGSDVCGMRCESSSVGQPACSGNACRNRGSVRDFPTERSRATGHPRTIAFQWSPVKGATQYGIEIDCFGCCVADTWCADSRSAYKVQALKEPAFTFDFWGDQPGRWRVWAIGADRAPSGKSPWSEFTFAPVAKD
jgi:hypothetical protein